MFLDKIGQQAHELVQDRTQKELCTFGVQYMQHLQRGGRQGFNPLSKRQFTKVLHRILNNNL